MGDKIKRMCKLDKKDFEKRFDQIAKAVSSPKYICEKCARVAGNKKLLCKPRKLDV